MALPKRVSRLCLCAALVLSCSLQLVGAPAELAAGKASKSHEPDGCSDPGSQLPCFCESINTRVSNSSELIGACYRSATQTPTFLQFGQFSAWSWSGINWPVSATNGVPDYIQDLRTVQGDNATVWESWKTAGDVFLPDGSAPRPWTDRERALPASCRAIDIDAAKSRYKNRALVPDALPPRLLNDFVNAEGDAAVDRYGEPLRYETVMNKTAFDYIVDNALYNADDQQLFFDAGKKVWFPFAVYLVEARGPYFLKAAWKVLHDSESFDDIHKAWAYIYPVFRNGTLVSDCELKPVGLVGLHVTYKLEQAKEWAWATFEHVRIAPGWHELREAGDDYMLFHGDCRSKKDCAKINMQPRLFPRDRDSPQPSQLVMQQTYGYGYVCNQPFKCKNSDVSWINATFAKELSSSVWANYKLKGTQWVDTLNHDLIKPVILANTAIEPYIQSTSSCIGCHREATVKAGSGVGQPVPRAPDSDHIYVLQKARPKISTHPH